MKSVQRLYILQSSLLCGHFRWRIAGWGPGTQLWESKFSLWPFLPSRNKSMKQSFPSYCCHLGRWCGLVASTQSPLGFGVPDASFFRCDLSFRSSTASGTESGPRLCSCVVVVDGCVYCTKWCPLYPGGIVQCQFEIVNWRIRAGLEQVKRW